MTLIKKYAGYGAAVAFAAVLAVALVVAGPARTAEATVSGGTIAGVAAADLVAGAENADYDVAFDTDIVATATTITVTFPVGYVISASPTIQSSTATAGSITADVGGAATQVAATSVVGSAAARTITITIPATNLSLTNGVAFRILTGVKNPALVGNTGTFSITTNATGETAQTNVAAVTLTQPATLQASLTATTTQAVGGQSQLQVALPAGLTTASLSLTGPAVFSNNATSIAPTDGQASTGDSDAAANNTLIVNIIGTGTAGTVTVSASGAVTTRTLTLTLVGGGATVTVAPSLATIPQGGTPTSNIVVTVRDSNGAAVSNASVSVLTTQGTFTGALAANSGTITTCAASSQSCTGTTNASGVFTPILQGAAAPGVATITATSNQVSGTATVTISGAVDAITAKTQSNIGVGTATAWMDSATPSTALYANNFRIVVSATDSAGNTLTNQTPSATYSPSSCAPGTSAVSNTQTTGVQAFITFNTAPGTTPAAGTVCTATVTVGTKTTTATWTIAGTTVSTIEIEATGQNPATSQTVTVTVKDSAGNMIADDTEVTLVASAGAVATPTAITKNGVATFTYVSPGTPQTVGLTAVSGSAAGTTSITVATGATPTPAPEGAGEFAAPPTFGDGNIGQAVFGPGTVDGLVASVTAAGGTAVWVQDAGGIFRIYSTSGPSFLNGPFTTAFPNGFAVATSVTVTK